MDQDTTKHESMMPVTLLPYRLRRILNQYGRPCINCGRMTLHLLNGVPLCVDCEEEGINEIRRGLE